MILYYRKSTLVHLICKLWTPTQGRITFDGMDSSQFSRISLREKISYVPQKPYIFQGTVGENISISNEDSTIDEIMLAAELAGIFTFKKPRPMSRREIHQRKKQIQLQQRMALRELKDQRIRVKFKVLDDGHVHVDCFPVEADDFLVDGQDFMDDDNNNSNGNDDSSDVLRLLSEEERRKQILETHLVARGLNISGGYQQSIALARIFLKRKSNFVILDESLSAIDPIRKRDFIFPNILNFIKENQMGLIMITHDMTDLKYVNHIILLENGNIECQGSFNVLLNNLKFAKMISK